MMNYKTNVKDYIDEDFLNEETYKIGDEVPFLPQMEKEANFCILEQIIKKKEFYTLIFRIENEFSGEKYCQKYNVNGGSKIEMNILTPNPACFLPPCKVSALVAVEKISEDFISLKTVGIRQDYDYTEEIKKN